MLKEYTPEFLKKFIWWFVQVNPFGSFCKFKLGKLDITVDKQFLVIMSDGSSTDALPLNFVSQELVNRVEQELLNKWYMPKFPETPPDPIQT